MSVLEMAAGAVEEPRPATDPSLDIRVLQRPTLVQPKAPKPPQGNPAEANRIYFSRNQLNSKLVVELNVNLIEISQKIDFNWTLFGVKKQISEFRQKLNRQKIRQTLVQIKNYQKLVLKMYCCL